MNSIFKKAAALALAAVITTGAIPPRFGGWLLQNPANEKRSPPHRGASQDDQGSGCLRIHLHQG